MTGSPGDRLGPPRHRRGSAGRGSPRDRDRAEHRVDHAVGRGPFQFGLGLEKQAVAQYGSSDSGASLGDILGAALKEKAEASAKETKKTKKK